MPANPILNALLRTQPTARRIDLPGGGGFDDATSAFSTPDGMSPSVELFGLQTDRKRELQDRLATATAVPNKFVPGELNALKSRLGFLEQDMEPMTNAIEANQAASIAGFPSSAAAGEFVRGLEEAKTFSPLRVAQATGAATVKGKEIGAQQARDVEAIRSKGALAKQEAIENTKLRNQDVVKGIVGQLQPGGRVSSTGTGGMSVTSPAAPRANINPLISGLATERARPDANPAAISQFEHGIAGQLNLDPESLDVVNDILNDPSLDIQSLEDLKTAFDLEGLDPLQILNVLSMIRQQQQPEAEPSALDSIRRFFGGQ